MFGGFFKKRVSQSSVRSLSSDEHAQLKQLLITRLNDIRLRAKLSCLIYERCDRQLSYSDADKLTLAIFSKLCLFKFIEPSSEHVSNQLFDLIRNSFGVLNDLTIIEISNVLIEAFNNPTQFDAESSNFDRNIWEEEFSDLLNQQVTDCFKTRNDIERGIKTLSIFSPVRLAAASESGFLVSYPPRTALDAYLQLEQSFLTRNSRFSILNASSHSSDGQQLLADINLMIEKTASSANFKGTQEKVKEFIGAFVAHLAKYQDSVNKVN